MFVECATQACLMYLNVAQPPSAVLRGGLVKIENAIFSPYHPPHRQGNINPGFTVNFRLYVDTRRFADAVSRRTTFYRPMNFP